MSWKKNIVEKKLLFICDDRELSLPNHISNTFAPFQLKLEKKRGVKFKNCFYFDIFENHIKKKAEKKRFKLSIKL